MEDDFFFLPPVDCAQMSDSGAEARCDDAFAVRNSTPKLSNEDERKGKFNDIEKMSSR